MLCVTPEQHRDHSQQDASLTWVELGVDIPRIWEAKEGVDEAEGLQQQQQPGQAAAEVEVPGRHGALGYIQHQHGNSSSFSL